MEKLEAAKIQTESLILNDIPLLFNLVMQLGVVESIDAHVEGHGNHQGLSTGWLVAIWLTHVLHTGSHAKSSVRDWVNVHKPLLETLSGEQLREVDFEDNRLGRVLTRLADEEVWLKIESSLWSKVIDMYELPSIDELLENSEPIGETISDSSSYASREEGESIAMPASYESPIPSVHIDLTGSSGYHVNSQGIMQYGKSKDHRPDLRQFKLVGAAFRGHLISNQVLPGNEADNPHYLPMAERVRTIVKKIGLLYVGDSKMADLQTRAGLEHQQDYYLTRLAATKGNAAFIASCIKQGMEKELDLLYKPGELLGGGYQLSRSQTATIEPEPGKQEQVQWTERVLVVRSLNYAQGQQKRLNRNIDKAIAAIEKLTPQPGRGKRQITKQEIVEQKIAAICEEHKLDPALLHIEFEKQVSKQQKYIGRGRAGNSRPKQEIEKVRFQIKRVDIDQQTLMQAIYGLGWIVYVTQVPQNLMSLTQGVITYRNNNDLENQFRRLKNEPLSIKPIYVKKDDQIRGLTNLLTIALRLMTYAEAIMQQSLLLQQKQEDREIAGLYPELPTKKTSRPSLKRCCSIFSNAEITKVNVYFDGKPVKSELHRFCNIHWKILILLNIPITVYTELRI